MTLSQKINARVPPEIKKALEEEAKRLDRSESYVINIALKMYLPPLSKPKAR
jgi:predicted transcriptional regulator